ncbi:uncharacterized protein EV154DRAFT_410731 [Mucor mucedo]|uniref:uncharacterized protein n=1 Tax=Mucor mucedo TaxID=29922 RepID=UPI002220DECE|nr:uncharacterized protein EV154DRAFT_410731 [Mucor mucedo]KAI7896858.1 hypothetical protein EV154DRAFT_410731 [Mucor mucedo]
MDDQDIKHFVRLYYFSTDNHGTTSEYKDLLLPGNTMINAISLEQDTILYSRDPDSYRFRVAALPDNLLLPPHSKKSSPIPLTTGQTGDLAKSNYQPNATELYTGLLCKLYSSNVETAETAYDASDIRGVQVNENGTLLAVWTKSKSIYIYKRGSADRVTKSWTGVGKMFDATASYINIESPHHLEKPLEWILRMVITPKEGHIGFVTPIGAAMFWNYNDSNFISIGMKNNIVNTYLIDEVEEQKAVNFQSFIRDKWDLWTVMTMIVTIFVVNEYKTYSY